MIRSFTTRATKDWFCILIILLSSCATTKQEVPERHQSAEREKTPVIEGSLEPIVHGEPVVHEQVTRKPLSKQQIAFNAALDLKFEKKISSKAWAAIKKFEPEFQRWTSNDFREHCGQPFESTEPGEKTDIETSVPWGVVGDFNDDGKQDLAVLGRTPSSDLVLVAMRKGSNYEVVEIRRFEPKSNAKKYGVTHYMEFMENSVISIPNEDYSFPLHGDAFVISHCDRNDILHYLEDGEFVAFALTEGPD